MLYSCSSAQTCRIRFCNVRANVLYYINMFYVTGANPQNGKCGKWLSKTIVFQTNYVCKYKKNIKISPQPNRRDFRTSRDVMALIRLMYKCTNNMY